MFQDDGSRSFRYDKEEYKILWGSKETGDVWDKGNIFYSKFLT